MAVGKAPAFSLPQREELARLRGLVEIVEVRRSLIDNGASSLRVFWRDGDHVCRRDIYPSGGLSPLMRGRSISALDR